MGLFDKIKKAVNNSGVIDAAKSAVNNLKGNDVPASPNKGANQNTFDIPMEKREPELTDFYNLFIESVNCKDSCDATAKGIASINAFITTYNPKLMFLDDSIKERIWDYTKYIGVFSEDNAKNKEDKNILLHFIYALAEVNDVEDFEEKVMYVWEKCMEDGEPWLYNSSLYSHSVFAKDFKDFKVCVEYLPENTSVEEIPSYAPSCELGDCVVFEDLLGEKLYCTCDSNASCSKKRAHDIGELWDDKLLPIMKAYVSAQNIDDYDKRRTALRKVAELILITYAPTLNISKVIDAVFQVVDINGIVNAPVVKYLANAQKHNFVFELEKVERYITVINMLNREGYRINIDAADWLHNASLYESKNLTYVLRMFITFSDKKFVKTHFLDDSVIDLKRFYNEDGTIKDAGDATTEGDTIYNIVEEWGKDNINQEVFDREQEEREQRRREEEQRRRDREAKERADKVQKAISTGKW